MPCGKGCQRDRRRHGGPWVVADTGEHPGAPFRPKLFQRILPSAAERRGLFPPRGQACRTRMPMALVDARRSCTARGPVIRHDRTGSRMRRAKRTACTRMDSEITRSCHGAADGVSANARIISAVSSAAENVVGSVMTAPGERQRPQCSSDGVQGRRAPSHTGERRPGERRRD